MEENKKYKLTYISLFSSAGVGCYGFKQNGFQCIATCELLKDRLDIQRCNHKCKYETGYIDGDLRQDNVKERLFNEVEDYYRKEHINSVDVILATPPCQGISTANCKKTDNDHKRNSLIVEAISIIDRIQPNIFVFENVPRFLQTLCTDIDGVDKTIKDAIFGNLGQKYDIYYDVINFKDYGVPSSRNRTIVIGVKRTITSLKPITLFPSKQKRITLKEAIGYLPHLEFAQKDKNDPFHFARPFKHEQLKWIENTKEGQSAFDQPVDLQPGKIDKEGNKVINKCSFMKNKYRRLCWNKVCPCIHTRNDTMSSNDTIHPTDNRVLSIRELMILMTIPEDFQWTDKDGELTPENSTEYLKKNELTIRRCIGEAVPTHIIADIAKKIKQGLERM